jgi:hypothetical protein
MWIVLAIFAVIGAALLGIVAITHYRNEAPESYERNPAAKAGFWICVSVVFLAGMLFFSR